MYRLIVVLVASGVGGIVQGATGFGATIVMMISMPMIFEISAAAAIASAGTIFMTTYLWVKYRKYIHYKIMIMPAVFSMIVSGISIFVIDYFDVNLLKIFFGIFLIILALYFLLFANKVTIKNSTATSIFCAVLAGFGMGFFAISGPPAGVYFLSATESREEYLGVINAYFTITLAYNTVIRIMNGIITVDMVPDMLLCSAGCMIGTFIALKIMRNVSAEMAKKIIYFIMIMAGIITVVQSM
ncbi:MAG: sulfite exporter TauE/SafE family protein [Eubacteriales bacterium]